MSTWPQALAQLPLYRRVGRVTRVTDLGIESRGPAAALGDICELRTTGGERMEAEVVAIHGDQITLMPYALCKGLTVGAEVVALDVQPSVQVGTGLLGQVVDAFARPIDGAIAGAVREMPLHPLPLNPLARAPINEPLETGIRAIDALLPLGRGQRMGIFAGSGVGKSSLLGMLARNLTADVAVIGLIGERGREVQDFLEKRLSTEARARTVVVVATAEQPAVVRARAAYTATSIAEYFRAEGRHVLLMMDSITRFAMARREIDLAAGQPPTARGYTPSVFSAIPALCERCGGLLGAGSITALYAVLVDGDDLNEPVSDALRATLDGHIVLSREMANAGHYPAIDVLNSVSRLDEELLKPDDRELAKELRSLLAVHRRQHDMVDMGLYKAGSNPKMDHALQNWDRINEFLRQAPAERSSLPQTRMALVDALSQRVAS
ncbi:flagellum-specific ATP synthase [Pelomonas saccharophila]|uniref:Flagellum-specific ATP synthase n=1 Tax=Roseateles saccharophilus TaxID=304 RepID=A0ABU1YH77_ROSSA|nr:FliI/YscN family ATPase [Roseateles saccharophilus]MDR7268214.1 flagellum-specific ATP synthase [Roseateles saccharophilus]